MSGHEADQGRLDRIAALGFPYAEQRLVPIDQCNLCGAEEWVIITHTDRYGYRARTTSCRRCSMTMLNPRMGRDAYSDFYAGTYRPLVSAFHGRRIDATSIKDEQREYAHAVADVVAPYIGDAATLLDIGGSTGVVAEHFAAMFGIDVTVLDPAPAELAEAEGSGLKTITGFVEEWQHDGRTFDAVGMFQTLDHLLDVAGALRTVREVLAPGGLFIADIVDFRAAYLRNASVEMATKIDHPFSLTQPTIEAHLLRAGLQPVLTSFSPDHLHILYVCRAADPDEDALPPQALVQRHFDEIREVQNAPRR